MAHEHDDTMTCDCCGGSLPMREVWEARWNGGADCTGSIGADGSCRAFDDDDWRLNAMAVVLNNHGSRFSGNNVADEAQKWLDQDFTSSKADGWCEIGVWDAGTAAEFRDAGLTPEEVKAASERLIEAEQAAWDEEPTPPDSQYTDGDPIYAACNGDLDVAVIIDAAKAQ